MPLLVIQIMQRPPPHPPTPPRRHCRSPPASSRQHAQSQPRPPPRPRGARRDGAHLVLAEPRQQRRAALPAPARPARLDTAGRPAQPGPRREVGLPGGGAVRPQTVGRGRAAAVLTVLWCAELSYRDLSGQMLPPVQTWRSPQLATTACSTATSCSCWCTTNLDASNFIM